jgi:hypothetical protein
VNWLRKFMIGRYGVDQLSVALLILSVILTIVGAFPNMFLLSYLGMVPLVICYFRALSRDHSKRYQENQKFLKHWNPVKYRFQKSKNRTIDQKTHKYFKCPKCAKTVRVPRGKGKICITCPVCKEEFIRKS